MEKKIRILHVDVNVFDRKLVKDILKNAQDQFIIAEAESSDKLIMLLAKRTMKLY
ncbi:MAG: hypothetical protein JXB49_25735 [Bacteroidales bacterium]|nr:hypothetical protein [Bacteroidales bacterium]